MRSHLSDILKNISPVSPDFFRQAQAHLDTLTKPPGSLGRLEELAARVVAIRKTHKLRVSKKCIYLFAADHGVTEEHVSAYPRQVTAQMVRNFLNGGAAINVLARHFNCELCVNDMGVDHDFGKLSGLVHNKIGNGTGNMRKGPAMTRRQAERALEIGMALAQEANANGIDLIGTGDMGIGNTTPSAAILSVLSGLPPGQTTGRGTGIDDRMWRHKVSVIEDAIRINQPDSSDPIDVLAKVGGFEIAGIAGLVLGASRYALPIVIDGVISIAAAVIACQINPNVGDYIFFAHQSTEPGCRIGFDLIGQKPLLNLDMRLGEGTGAVLAMNLIEAAVKIYSEMATFKQTGISENGNGSRETTA